MSTRLPLPLRLGLVLIASLQAGCERRGIEVYSVDKEVPEEAVTTAASILLPESPAETWQAVDTAGSPRRASFRVRADAGGAETADMSVISFPGEAGGLLANVNRWRGEMAQNALSESEFEDATERIAIGDHSLHIVDAANAERRTLGAILPLATETWFFKLTGPEPVVAANRDAFFSYLSGIEIAAAAPPAPVAAEPQPDRPKLTYQKPEAWIEGEPTTMRVASFTVTGDEGREADIAVIPLGGSGGAQLAIINQWRSTLRLDSATKEQLPNMIEALDVGGRTFQLVNFESEEAMLESDRKARIIVAYATAGEHTWFFKIAGETSLVAEQKPVLLEFLESVEFDAP